VLSGATGPLALVLATPAKAEPNPSYHWTVDTAVEFVVVVALVVFVLLA
jgi:hypothetical protein